MKNIKKFLTFRVATHTHSTNIRIITRKKGKCSFYWTFSASFKVFDNFLYITHFLLIKYCFIAFSYSIVYCCFLSSRSYDFCLNIIYPSRLTAVFFISNEIKKQLKNTSYPRVQQCGS